MAIYVFLGSFFQEDFEVSDAGTPSFEIFVEVSQLSVVVNRFVVSQRAAEVADGSSELFSALVEVAQASIDRGHRDFPLFNFLGWNACVGHGGFATAVVAQRLLVPASGLTPAIHLAVGVGDP